MENEMIERVAKALWDHSVGFIGDPHDPPEDWDEARPDIEEWRDTARRAARAAIEAMRELPESLWDDGGALDPDVIGYDPSPTTSWETIIDAALGIAKIPDILD